MGSVQIMSVNDLGTRDEDPTKILKRVAEMFSL